MRLDGLDLNLLVALEAILRLRSVSLAAREAKLTQPAMSRSLTRLRTHFGDRLVIPAGREMVPTEFARTLHPVVQRLLREMRAVSQLRPDFDPASARREFTVISSDYVTQVLLTRAIARLATIGSGITLRCIPIDRSSSELFARGDIDFQVVPDVALDPQHPWSRLFSDSFVSIVWTENDLVGEEMDFDTFRRLRHVATTFGSDRYDSHFERYLKSRAIDLDTAMLVPSFVLLPSCIVGTPLVATIQAHLAAMLPRELPVRIVETPVDVPPLVENLQWHRLREQDAASIWMRSFLVEVAAGLEPVPRKNARV